MTEPLVIKAVCSYCGYQFDGFIVEIAQQHMSECPNHPYAALKKENEELKWQLQIKDTMIESLMKPKE